MCSFDGPCLTRWFDLPAEIYHNKRNIGSSREAVIIFLWNFRILWASIPEFSGILNVRKITEILKLAKQIKTLLRSISHVPSIVYHMYPPQHITISWDYPIRISTYNSPTYNRVRYAGHRCSMTTGVSCSFLVRQQQIRFPGMLPYYVTIHSISHIPFTVYYDILIISDTYTFAFMSTNRRGGSGYRQSTNTQ